LSGTPKKSIGMAIKLYFCSMPPLCAPFYPFDR
jgi:hypothetical protein